MKQNLSSNQKLEIVSYLTENFVFTAQCVKMKDLFSPDEILSNQLFAKKV